MLRHQCHPCPTHLLLWSLAQGLVSAPCLCSPSLAFLPGIPIEAARCQLGNLLTLPHLPKWTVSPLIRYPPRGQMSAPLMAFLSSALLKLLTASERSGPIMSRRLLPAGLPFLPAQGLCQPGSSSPTTPPSWAHHLPLLKTRLLKESLLKGWKITGTGGARVVCVVCVCVCRAGIGFPCPGSAWEKKPSLKSAR